MRANTAVTWDQSFELKAFSRFDLFNQAIDISAWKITKRQAILRSQINNEGNIFRTDDRRD